DGRRPLAPDSVARGSVGGRLRRSAGRMAHAPAAHDGAPAGRGEGAAGGGCAGDRARRGRPAGPPRAADRAGDSQISGRAARAVRAARGPVALTRNLYSYISSLRLRET